jgi:hypothetical protein
MQPYQSGKPATQRHAKERSEIQAHLYLFPGGG